MENSMFKLLVCSQTSIFRIDHFLSSFFKLHVRSHLWVHSTETDTRP